MDKFRMGQSIQVVDHLSADVGGLTMTTATSVRKLNTRIVGANWVMLACLCVNVNSLPFSPVLINGI